MGTVRPLVVKSVQIHPPADMHLSFYSGANLHAELVIKVSEAKSLGPHALVGRQRVHADVCAHHVELRRRARKQSMSKEAHALGLPVMGHKMCVCECVCVCVSVADLSHGDTPSYST